MTHQNQWNQHNQNMPSFGGPTAQPPRTPQQQWPGPQQPYPSVPSYTPPQPPRRDNKPIVVGVLAGALVLVVSVGVYLGINNAQASRTAIPSSGVSSRIVTPSDSVPPPPGVNTQTSAPTAEQAAIAELYRQSAADLARTPRHGQWVAQLSSKWVGVTDKYQIAYNGSHTFYGADILAEYQALKNRVSGVDVVLLNSKDYGKKRHKNGEPYWVVSALSPQFTSEDAVTAWCASQFPELSGDERINQCMPNRLMP